MDICTRLRRSPLFRAILLLVIVVPLLVMLYTGGEISSGSHYDTSKHHRSRLSSEKRLEDMLQRHRDFLGEADAVLGSLGNRSSMLLLAESESKKTIYRASQKSSGTVEKNRIGSSGSDKHNSSHAECINILFILTDIRGRRESSAHLFLSSLLKSSNAALCCHVIADTSGEKIANAFLSPRQAQIQTIFYDSEAIAKRVSAFVTDLRSSFSSGPGNYFNNAVFFIAPVLHELLPAGTSSNAVERVIFLDTDLKLQADIAELYDEFEHFKPGQLVGMAYENQPVYKHLLAQYTALHPDSWLGRPYPNGIIGYNSGVILQDLKAIRQNKEYLSLLIPAKIKQLLDKYMFKGHLGGQDLFTLISLDYQEFFYRLPCQWNRQLCRFWQKGYEAIFDKYYQCDVPLVKIYHGNCQTSIPNQ
ncbi:xyloside xylosyltransferase 1-like [Sycon ciliatum]|uniref:xyloside xylosyltransferase 1-like n=1 Tax=Sycon ciliatum TaxID=27933 RepID=UPI0020A897CE|eukprot:scpid86675/ scgid32848/ Xyloside xylosyltransferase 1; UDP-xylose:alpha-xyloside alpha-1,3-xylosyltransferase